MVRCRRCGSVDDAGSRFCQRCGALLPRFALAALVPAYSTAQAIPAVAAISRDPPPALVAALAGSVQALLPPLASGSRPQRLLPQGTSAAPPAHSALPAWLVAGGGLVALSAVLFVAAQLGLPSARLADWTPEPPAAPDADVDESPPPDVPPAPSIAPATIDLPALERALNEELQRAGFGGVQVLVDVGGVATARGSVDSEGDRRALLEWLQGHDGIRDVHDALRVAVPEPPVMPAAPPPPRERPAQPPRPPARPGIDGPGAATPPARPRMGQAASPRNPPERAPASVPPVESRPPVVEARPPAPDAATIARGVQRELARLGLEDVAVAVDPATLVVTLRGRTRDAARKAEALAAARAAAPGSRVRDLVFVIEE